MLQLTLRPANRLERELYGRIKENLGNLYTALLIDGVKDKKTNLANLNEFLLAMRNDCAQIQAYEDVVLSDNEEAEIEQIRKLVLARDDEVYKRLASAEFNSFSEDDAENFETLQGPVRNVARLV